MVFKEKFEISFLIVNLVIRMKGMSVCMFQVIIPAVCVFGMIGNVLNLTILTRRTHQNSVRKLEKAGNFCLISLAVEDLMFCTFV